MNRKIWASAAALVFAACATEPRPQLAYGLSPGDVSNGFIMSVLEACVVAAERGVTLDQMGNYRILRDTIRSTARPPKLACRRAKADVAVSRTITSWPRVSKVSRVRRSPR